MWTSADQFGWIGVDSMSEHGGALSIGVRVQSSVARLHATLASLRANSGRAFRLVLLPDGPDEEMIGKLRGMREPQLPTQKTLEADDPFQMFNARIISIVVIGADGLIYEL